jgi:spermidine synthase
LLTNRISERKLVLAHVREDNLRDTLSPFRLDYLHTLLDQIRETGINRDFTPVCFLHTLMLWASQWHPAMAKFFAKSASLSPYQFWAGCFVIVIVFLIFFWAGRARFRAATAISVMGVGAIEMAIVIILLLTFQILEGFVYRQLALIITFYMAGLGLGAGCVAEWKPLGVSKRRGIQYFIRVQLLIGIFPIFLLLLFNLIHGEYRHGLSSVAIGWIFSGLSLTAGLLGGIHFSLAVYASALLDVPSEKIGGELYAVDLIGSAGGVLIISLFVIPVFGIMNTLILLSLVSFVCALILMRGPKSIDS